MPRMNHWHMKWDLHEDICPCDVHFNDWLTHAGVRESTIYHFGSGTHHVVGAVQAKNGSGNRVFAVTASKGELDAYVDLVNGSAEVARAYVCYYGDVYLTNPQFLPPLDVASLFHLCEFSNEETGTPTYGGVDDRGLLDLITQRTRPGGHILFYEGSNGFEKSKPLIRDWVARGAADPVETFKTLTVYRKR